MDRLVPRLILWCSLLTATFSLAVGLNWTNIALAQTDAPQASATQASAEPLHVAIDRLLGSSLPHLTARPADDGIFLRRLSLDLRGVVPTGEELSEFKADPKPDKRAAWVDRFLTDTLHQERMVDWLDKTFMHRRPFAQVDRNAWIAWLRTAVEQRTPLHTLITQMLTAPWWDNSGRPALRFFLDRGGDPHMITRDLSRVLLGRDMQCNQCHNHPLVDEYKQVDYHGMLAFVSASGLAEGTTKDDKGADVKSQMYIERAGADAPFESVFEKGVPLRTGPRLPVSTEIFEAYLEPDVRLQKTAATGAFVGLPNAPLVSRRGLLAESLTKQHARVLARNFANRLWAIAFGRGLVHPLDMHHADNPASHPELLELLTTSLIELQYDYDKFLKEIMLSQAYGRAADVDLRAWPIAAGVAVEAGSGELAEIAQAATSQKEKLTAELNEAQGVDKASEESLETINTQWRAAQATRHAARVELDKAEAAFVDVKKKSDDAQAAHSAAAKKQQDTTSRISLLDEAQAKLQQAIALTGADDAELKAAIATAKTRADTARAELPALEKAATDTRAAAEVALTAVDAPRAKVKEVASALDVEQQKLAMVDTDYATARQTWAVKHARVVSLEQQIERADNCLKLVQAVQEARAALNLRSQSEAQLTSLESKLPEVDQQLQQATDALAAGNKLQADAQAQLASSRQLLVKHESELMQLRETLAGLEKATGLVTMPEPLKAAATTINETLANKNSATLGLTATIAQHEQAVAAATAQVTQLQSARAARDQARTAHHQAMSAQKMQRELQTARLEELIGQAREAWNTVLEDQQVQLAVGRQRALSPEQMGQSVLRVTGIFDSYVTAEVAELQKTAPLPTDAAPEAVAAKAGQLRKAVLGATDKLRGNVDVFAGLYASGVGQTADEFFASPDQALFMANGGSVFPWSGPNGSGPEGKNITARIIAQKDNTAAAMDLYNTLLARDPLPSEMALVSEQLAGAGDARAAVSQEMVWAILTSVEFRFYR
ncbi:MAG: DUF1549 domain-containing protein [Pirellulaceae bacterium]|nr:DUF1549 domain-containing protein [Pirellulaceae bacterium]